MYWYVFPPHWRFECKRIQRGFEIPVGRFTAAVSAKNGTATKCNETKCRRSCYETPTCSMPVHRQERLSTGKNSSVARQIPALRVLSGRWCQSLVLVVSTRDAVQLEAGRQSCTSSSRPGHTRRCGLCFFIAMYVRTALNAHVRAVGEVPRSTARSPRDQAGWELGAFEFP